MARLTFKRLLLVGVAVAAGAAYAKRDTVRQLLPGGSSPEPEPYSPPAPPQPSNYDAPGPPANTATPVPAPDPVVTPEPGRSEPVEEAPIQVDDTLAVEDAIADAAAAAEESGGHTTPAAAPTGGVDTPAEGDPPSQLGFEAGGPDTASAAPAAGEPTAEADTQVMPEPIDEAAEEAAAAAEAAAIGGSAGNEYEGSEPGEPITEAERPVAEAGGGVSEGQEQAEAELQENAESGEGVSDAERQIEDAIEAAGNPAIGETPEPASPTEEPAKEQDDDDISGGDWQTWSGGAVKPQ